MKKLILLLSLMAGITAAHGVELVCKGQEQRNPQQRAYFVDCSNRKVVIDSLGASFSLLRQEGIGGATENLCWDPYQRAKEMPPSINFLSLAQNNLFPQCNAALQYVK